MQCAGLKLMELRDVALTVLEAFCLLGGHGDSKM
jgi:hypothetical protein